MGYVSDGLSFLPTVSPEHIKAGGATSNTEDYFIEFVKKNPFGTITDDLVEVFNNGASYLHSGMYTFELGDAGARRWGRASRTCGRRMGTRGRSRTTTRQCGQRGRPRQQLARRRRPWPHDYVKHLGTGHSWTVGTLQSACQQGGHQVWLRRFSSSRPYAVNMLTHC